MNKRKYDFDLANGRRCTLEILNSSNIVYFNLILSKNEIEINRMLLTKDEFFAFIDCYHSSRVDLFEANEDDS